MGISMIMQPIRDIYHDKPVLYVTMSKDAGSIINFSGGHLEDVEDRVFEFFESEKRAFSGIDVLVEENQIEVEV